MKHPLGTIAKGVTFGVNSRSNVKALMLCLSSVLIAPLAPQFVRIRLEGEFPSFGEFYLEQLAEIARIRGIELSIHSFASKGTRKARQWQLDTCPTDYLWMGDDDCIYLPNCLLEFSKATEFIYTNCLDIKEGEKALGFISGCKPDVNNRRGYLNFDTVVHPQSKAVEGCSHNHFYEIGDSYPKARLLDTGNVFLNTEPLRSLKVRFDPFENSPNASGEDTLFALQADKVGLSSFFAPNAVALHLEKPGASFSEFAARAEMLALACKVLNLDEGLVRRDFMKGVWPEQNV